MKSIIDNPLRTHAFFQRFLQPKLSAEPAVDCSDAVIHVPEPQKGLPTVRRSAILDHYAALIGELRAVLDLAEPCFVDRVLPVLDRMAGRVHLLPASEHHHHSYPGGLFRHGLEVAIQARRYSEDFLYGREAPAEVQHESEEAWRLALSLTGLLHDLGKPLVDMEVTDQSGHRKWNPYMGALDEWAKAEGLERYFLSWKPRRHGQHPAMGGCLVLEMLGSPLIGYLTRHGHEPFQTLYRTVIGFDVEERFGRLVMQADRDSVARDLQGSAFSPGPSSGVRKEDLLLQSMADLVAGGYWRIEAEDAVLIFHEGNLFIDWYAAQTTLGDSLQNLSSSAGLDSPDELADFLIERGFAIPCPALTGKPKRYWSLEARNARWLRLRDPALIGCKAPDMPIMNSESEEAIEGNVHPAPSLILAETDELVPNIIPPTLEPTAPPVNLQLQEAEAWLQGLNPADQIKQTLDALFMHRDSSMIHLIEGQLWIAYPDTFKASDLPPTPTITCLQAAGLLQLDPRTGMRAVWDQAAGRGCLFSPQASRYLALLWELTETVAPSVPTSPAVSDSHAQTAIRQSRKSGNRHVFTPERLRAIARMPDEK